MVYPSSVDNPTIYAIEADDVVSTEEGIEEEADHSCDAVFSEDVHAVVDSDPIYMLTEVLFDSRDSCLDTYQNLSLVEKLATTPVTIPRITAAQGGMKPDAGVAATRPEIHPEHHPTILHFLASL